MSGFDCYKTSRDYKRLAELAKTQRIVCFVDYDYRVGAEAIRDVAATRCVESSSGSLLYYMVNARGIGYVDAHGEEAFIRQCEKVNLEFIEPKEVNVPSGGGATAEQVEILRSLVSRSRREAEIWRLNLRGLRELNYETARQLSKEADAIEAILKEREELIRHRKYALESARLMLRRKYKGAPLWALAQDLFHHGSTVSSEICASMGYDPNQDAGAKELKAIDAAMEKDSQ